MPKDAAPPVLTLRELNRALLARQMLLERQRVRVVDAVERLGGLQAQWAPAPYVALWTRLAGFKRDQLTTAIDKGELIKATLMRATLHLVSAREYPAYSLATLDGRFGAWRPPAGPLLTDLGRMHADVLRFAAKTPRTREEIRKLDGTVAAEAGSVIVPRDPGGSGSRPLSPAERAVLVAAIEEPRADAPAGS